MKNIDKYIDLLSPKDICSYLKNQNWTETPKLSNGRIRQFTSPDDTDSVIIPNQEIFSDYNRILTDSLNTIAEYEKLSIIELFNKLNNPTCDILRWRINNIKTSAGNIPIMSMKDNIDYIKNILSSTCLDILNPSIYHKKTNIKDVTAQIEKYQFGQTEIGSYVLNLICPLGNYQYQLFDPEDELPLSRKINIKLLNNISIIQKSIEQNSDQLKEEIDQSKISLNFINDLNNLYSVNKDSQLSITAELNSAIPFDEEKIVNKISLNPDYSEKLIDIYNSLLPEDEFEEIYYGKITNINGNPEIDEREDYTVTITTISNNKNVINVKAILNYNQFKDIVQNAFDAGSNVRIEGTINPDTKNRVLTNAKIQKLD